MKTRRSLLWILSPLTVAAALVFTSCSEDRNVLNYQTHPDGWSEPSAAEFHGAAALADGGTGCTGCHGPEFLGQGDAVSCYECHGYTHLGVSNSEPVTHRAFLADVTWNLARCARCHGSDYAGGTSQVSCLGCHTDSGGPAACGTCHGLPPVNDDNLLYGRPRGSAGAHATHARFACRECHGVVNGLGHVDALPAEVTFASAQIATAHGFAPVFLHTGSARFSNGSCGNIYCHSDGRGGAAEPVVWQGGLLGCKSCHGVPPASHNEYTPTRCHLCHTNVDPTSDYSIPNSIRFLVDSLHVNGQVEVSLP
jgi:predicted CxxxxCH...CXXCH cytochrome family protein